MRKNRIIAILCILALLMCHLPTVMADTPAVLKSTTADKRMGWDEYRLVKNNETVSFVLFSYAWNLLESRGGKYYNYDDLVYDCEGSVTGKSSAKWIHVEAIQNDLVISFDENYSRKPRSGNVTVTGNGYSATLKFTQYGFDNISSAVRKGKKVTLKFKYAKGAKNHYLTISAYKTGDSQNLNKTIVSEENFKKTSYTFEVEEGWSYSVSTGIILNYTSPDGWQGSMWSSGDYLYFGVTSTSGSETIK